MADDDDEKLDDYLAKLQRDVTSDDPAVRDKAQEEAKVSMPIIEALQKKKGKK